MGPPLLGDSLLGGVMVGAPGTAGARGTIVPLLPVPWLDIPLPDGDVEPPAGPPLIFAPLPLVVAPPAGTGGAMGRGNWNSVGGSTKAAEMSLNACPVAARKRSSGVLPGKGLLVTVMLRNRLTRGGSVAAAPGAT